MIWYGCVWQNNTKSMYLFTQHVMVDHHVFKIKLPFAVSNILGQIYMILAGGYHKISFDLYPDLPVVKIVECCLKPHPALFFLSFPGWKNWATVLFPQLPRFLVSRLIIEISSCPNMQTKPSAFRRWSASCRLAMASWRAFGPGLKTNLKWWRCTGMAQRLQGNS